MGRPLDAWTSSRGPPMVASVVPSRPSSCCRNRRVRYGGTALIRMTTIKTASKDHMGPRTVSIRSKDRKKMTR